jgi:integrase
MALCLVEATGRRRGSVRGLRWSAIDFEAGTIYWDPAFEKTGAAGITPMPQDLRLAMQTFAEVLGTESDWLFPNAAGTGPWALKLFDDVLLKAEQEAGLPKLAGGLWHPYRRKWRTERKLLNPKEVQAAGGWADATTMQVCYEGVDAAVLYDVVNAPYKLTAAGITKIER